MGRLDPATASKLAKICGMFGSSHDGERASAALQAAALVKRAGVTWDDLLKQPAPVQHRAPASQPTANAPGVHRSVAAWALRFPAELSTWEAGFLASIQRRRKPVTSRQAAFLNDIVDRLRQAGAA